MRYDQITSEYLDNDLNTEVSIENLGNSIDDAIHVVVEKKNPEELSADDIGSMAYLAEYFGTKVDEYGSNRYLPLEDLFVAAESIYLVRNEGSSTIIAFAVITDPDIEDWSGEIPRDYYELEIGTGLGDRKERLMTVIDEKFVNSEIPTILETHISKDYDRLFAPVALEDSQLSAMMVECGYSLIGTFVNRETDTSIGIWLSNPKSQVGSTN